MSPQIKSDSVIEIPREVVDSLPYLEEKKFVKIIEPYSSNNGEVEPFWERVWHRLTIYGDQGKVTGFGIIYFYAAKLFAEGEFEFTIWLLIIPSIILLIIAFIKLKKEKPKGVRVLYLINSFLLAILYIGILTTNPSFKNVLWGFFAYSGMSFFLTFYSSKALDNTT